MYGICGAKGSNTGALACDTTRGNPERLIFGGGSVSPSNYATFALLRTAIMGFINLPAGSANKAFPIPVIQDVTDQTEAAKFDTLGYGLKVKLLRSKPSYEFDVLCGSALEKKLIAFDGLQMPVGVIDDEDILWGILDGQENFQYPLWLVSVEPRSFGDAKKAKTTKISISIVNTKDYLENAAWAPTAFGATDLDGLFDVQIAQTVAPSSNVFKLGATIATGEIGASVNVHDTAAAALAVTGAWAASTPAGTIAITSVADDPTHGGWTVTLNSTAFSALAPGTVVTIGLATPAALNVLDVTQLDSTLGMYTFITS